MVRLSELVGLDQDISIKDKHRFGSCLLFVLWLIQSNDHLSLCLSTFRHTYDSWDWAHMTMRFGHQVAIDEGAQSMVYLVICGFLRGLRR